MMYIISNTSHVPGLMILPADRVLHRHSRQEDPRFSLRAAATLRELTAALWGRRQALSMAAPPDHFLGSGRPSAFGTRRCHGLDDTPEPPDRRRPCCARGRMGGHGDATIPRDPHPTATTHVSHPDSGTAAG